MFDKKTVSVPVVASNDLSSQLAIIDSSNLDGANGPDQIFFVIMGCVALALFWFVNLPVFVVVLLCAGLSLLFTCDFYYVIGSAIIPFIISFFKLLLSRFVLFNSSTTSGVLCYLLLFFVIGWLTNKLWSEAFSS